MTFRQLLGQYLVRSSTADSARSADEVFLADLFGIRTAFDQIADAEGPGFEAALEESAKRLGIPAHILTSADGEPEPAETTHERIEASA